MKYDQKTFIDKSNKIHNFKYNYSEMVYCGTTKKISTICPIHGEFSLKRAIEHICNDYRGCPKCRIKERLQK